MCFKVVTQQMRLKSEISFNRTTNIITPQALGRQRLPRSMCVYEISLWSKNRVIFENKNL